MQLPIQPGATLGMLGGGQLGRMFAQAAMAMGYRVMVLDPDPLSPTGQVADWHIEASYTDADSLNRLAESCAAVSIEFESIPAEALRALEGRVRLTPSLAAVEIAQNRILEKQFIRDHGLATANFRVVKALRDIDRAFSDIDTTCILKTATLGYDGKGQVVCHSAADVREAFMRFGEVPCVLEEKVDLRTEVSVVLARSDNGAVCCFPVAENTHVNGILDISLVPAQVDDQLQSTAVELATSLANALDYVGVLGVEMFVSGDSRVMINEIAPRPHNSGHFTLDATVTSQFEQQVRMMCGLPPGDPGMTSPVAMLNLLGDVWTGGEPDWDSQLPHDAFLHLYGKKEARAGRKMGHINILRATASAAHHAASTLKDQLY